MPQYLREHKPLFKFFNLEAEKIEKSLKKRKPRFRLNHLYIATSILAASLIIGLMVYFGTTQNTVLENNAVYLTVNGERIYDEEAVKEFTMKQLPQSTIGTSYRRGRE